MEKTLLEKVIKKMGLTEGELGLPQHPKTTLPLTLWYDHEREELILLDQNRLPFEETVWTTKNWKDAAWKGIKEMTVRGSQAIGVTGAYALLLAALSTIDFEEELKKRAYEISHVRPTAAPSGPCTARTTPTSTSRRAWRRSSRRGTSRWRSWPG